jgi:glycosyltransferase involved in cell wall biosynthesis
VLRAAAALGDRIRLVKLAVNAGTYAARNAGLEAAGGEFAAFQDSDDWSHPRRLELQVRPMLEDRRLVATTSDGLAVTDQLMLSRPGCAAAGSTRRRWCSAATRCSARSAGSTGCARPPTASTSGRIQAAFGARRGAATRRAAARADPAERELAVPLGDQAELDAPGAGRVQLGVPCAGTSGSRTGAASPVRPADGS